MGLFSKLFGSKNDAPQKTERELHQEHVGRVLAQASTQLPPHFSLQEDTVRSFIFHVLDEQSRPTGITLNTLAGADTDVSTTSWRNGARSYTNLNEALQSINRVLEQPSSAISHIQEAVYQQAASVVRNAPIIEQPQQARATTPASTPERVEAGAFGPFRNVHLINLWNTLTAEEQKMTQELADSLRRTTFAFKILATKPHALHRPSAGKVLDHCGFTIKSDPQEPTSTEMDQKLRSTMSSDIVRSLSIPDISSVNVVQILKHPLVAGRVLLKCRLKSPDGQSNYDPRSCGNQYLLSLDENSPVLSFLRSEHHARLFPLALQLAAVSLNEDAKIFMDIPLVGELINKHGRLVIMDIPTRTIFPCGSMTIETKVHTKHATSDAEFAQYAQDYGAGSTSSVRNDIFYSWPEPPVAKLIEVSGG